MERNRSATEWIERAACQDEDPAIFFPADGPGVKIAQEICRDCPVRLNCLEYALANRIEYGVWGGESERQRRLILKHRGEQ